MYPNQAIMIKSDSDQICYNYRSKFDALLKAT
jgi:hypothetical protein